ncbi:MAG TPA: outer membrane protein assembly factor BamD [Oceanicaulis sp.]|jgi:outer membrane protein assembly factor BamD|uniref:outer membrane protein assembly factor BamD n=1 Tax=Glycocaulis albus TaxID=1382801 RepID=UPI000ECF8407|nr:outer membrane protein assembly factor BamD [Synechococcus moorigangaii CMS01]HCY55411.1 outer membrane protein assembly factor BamD [Oceanicaulis sp.]
MPRGQELLNATRLILVISLSALVLAGCQGNRNRAELAYVARPVETLYNNAFRELERRRYTQAATLFDEVERQHPFSEWARRSILMAAFANYQAGRYEQAIANAERFIALHPGSSSAPYAYYLIAISHYERIYDVGRDQSTTQAAYDALQQVVRRFPDSPYARDARLKIDMTRDHLAGKDMDVGRWYLRNGFHLAAIGRFQNVIREYGTTSHVPEALHRLVEAYVAMGVAEEARQVAAVLGHNFPGSAWYQDSYTLLTSRGIDVPGEGVEESDPGLLRRAMSRIFG